MAGGTRSAPTCQSLTLREGWPLGSREHEVFYKRLMIGAPGAKRNKRLRQGQSEGRHLVVHPRGHLVIVATDYDRVGDKFAQVLNKDLLADAGDEPPEFREPRRAILQMEKDQGFPFAPDHRERHVQSTGEFLARHTILHTYF